ncbi:PAS domain-containing sensor histidine kinase [Pontibacter vulgaris]|uniref:PAS domain-containing sensor histidine kinase n=1 Tax=Pontibacter vulgaris TaxID=2905679 RepID=UPI001FA71C53|nr:PAS domain-containing sensor histidine kinase [Pontibacter vulgaris]
MNNQTESHHSVINKASLIQEEENVFQLLIEGIQDYGIFMLSPTGEIATWNQGARNLKGYTAEEIIGRHFSVFYTQQALVENFPQYELEEAIKHGRFEDEGWRVKKDGSTFWANVIITPVYNSKKEHIGFSKVTRDLSLRKKSEDDLFRSLVDLKESEERFRLMIEGVKDYAIFMLDPAGNVATWNEGARKIKGYEAKEIIGKHFSKFYGKEAVDEGYPQYELEQAVELGRFEDEGWRIRKDGSTFWANVIITAIYNSKNELIGFSKITRNLTEKKQLEEQLYRANEELRESEERARLLIDGVKDYAIFMLSPEGYIATWNAGAERIKGYKAKEVIGRHFSMFYNREGMENGFPQYELGQAKKNGRFEDEGWRIRKDGSAIWVNVVITPVYNEVGRLLGYTKITRDLSERRKNEELMLKNRELLKINTDLDNFVYTASHDLKAPIANIEGLVTLLKDEMGTAAVDHQDVLDRIDHSIIRLQKVISDLTEITKVQQDESAVEEVDIEMLYEEIKEGLSEQINNCQACLIAEFTEHKLLKYSRKNLRSILYNLISNAVKYATPGIEPEIKVKTELIHPDTLLLSVSDNGLGIDRSQQGKIFSMFKRVHHHVEGSGIGLYIVKRILENSGDRIEVESKVGKGSTFKVYFKLK